MQAYQFLTQKKKKRSGRAMTENWSMVRGQYCWKWQLRTVVDSKTWQIRYLMAIWLTNQNDKKYNWHSMLYVAVDKLLVIVPSFRGSVGEKMEGIKLIFIFVSCTLYMFVSCSLHIFVSCHNKYLCLLHQVGSKAVQEGGGAVGNLVQVHSQWKFLDSPKIVSTCTFWVKIGPPFLPSQNITEWKIGPPFLPSQNVGNFVQKLKAGASAEAKGEENPGLLADNSTSNNNNNINNNTSNNNNRKGKRNGFKTLVKKEQVSSAADIQKHFTSKSKKAAEPESQNPALPVDWSSWDAS